VKGGKTRKNAGRLRFKDAVRGDSPICSREHQLEMEGPIEGTTTEGIPGGGNVNRVLSLNRRGKRAAENMGGADRQGNSRGYRSMRIDHGAVYGKPRSTGHSTSSGSWYGRSSKPGVGFMWWTTGAVKVTALPLQKKGQSRKEFQNRCGICDV